MTNEDRIAVLRWAEWTELPHAEPVPLSMRVFRPKGSNLGFHLQDLDTDLRAYMPLFERLACEHRMLLGIRPGSSEWQCSSHVNGSAAGHGATPGEAVCRAILAVIERESHLDKKAKPQ